MRDEPRPTAREILYRDLANNWGVETPEESLLPGRVAPQIMDH